MSEPSEVTGLERFGDSRDWKSVLGRYLTPFLLKTDGTLWVLGTNQWEGIKKWSGLQAFLPQRIGADSDWERIFEDNGRTFLLKSNGQVWAEPPFENSRETKIVKPGLMSVSRAPWLENREWIDVASYFVDGFTILAGVFKNGTFREVASYEWLPTPKELSKSSGPHPANHGSMEYVQQDIPIGQETNWLGSAGENKFAVTLKTDGTLWRWNKQSIISQLGVRVPNLGDPHMIYPVNFSSHSDWVAIGQMMDGIVSLAADGSLYFWKFQPETDYYYGYLGIGMNSSWLQVTRRPVFLGNIFSHSN